jgi:hypothetical protein
LKGVPWALRISLSASDKFGKYYTSVEACQSVISLAKPQASPAIVCLSHRGAT